MASRRRHEEVTTPAAPAPVVPAGPQVVKIDGRTFAAVPQIASAVVTIDGYVFVGMPYYYTTESQFANPTDASQWVEAPISAVGTWSQLLADPNYLSLPPVTSVSVDTTVSGSVEDAPVEETPVPA